MASTAEQRRFAGIVVAVLVLDVVTKYFAVARLPRYREVPILGDIFQLQLVYNPGAAFGIHIGEYSRWFFTALTIVALVVLAVMARQTKPGAALRFYAIAAVMAGAAGNLIDRLRSGQGVVDFLLFSVGSFRWPNFNVADMAVSCGAVALAVALWTEDRPRHPSASPGAAPPEPG
jgi:signal peptidase II